MKRSKAYRSSSVKRLDVFCFAQLPLLFGLVVSASIPFIGDVNPTTSGTNPLPGGMSAWTNATYDIIPDIVPSGTPTELQVGFIPAFTGDTQTADAWIYIRIQTTVETYNAYFDSFGGFWTLTDSKGHSDSGVGNPATGIGTTLDAFVGDAVYIEVDAITFHHFGTSGLSDLAFRTMVFASGPSP